MQLEQSIAVRQTAEKEERSFAGFCGHQLQMCGCSQVEHRAAVLPAAVLQCCSHTRLLTRGHRGAVFNNVNVEMYFHVFKELFTALCTVRSRNIIKTFCGFEQKS